MNSLKTAVILAVLLGAAYWVYERINTAQPPSAPPEAAQGWTSGVDIELPAAGGGPGYAGSWGDPAAGYQAMAADGATAGSAAPPFTSAAGFADAIPSSYAAPSGTGATGAPLFDSAVAPEASLEDPPPFPPAGYPSPSSSRSEAPLGGFDGMAVTSDMGSPAEEAVATAGGSGAFDRLMEIVQHQLDAGSLAEALEMLSRFYGDSKFSAEESRNLTDLLDQIAGTVIYGRQHLLEPPRVVRPGETLDQIAEEYAVPAGLLAKINGLRDPQSLQPGQELKVVRGPFQAVVELAKRELTVFLQGRYAGRFRIGVGRQCEQLEGIYEVKDKTVNPTYYGPDQVIDAEDPRNPWGERWIGLGEPGGDAAQTARVGIHGTENPLNVGSLTERGIISLGSRDVEDVYDILSVGSKVIIRR
jgi:LysM repeat protein